MKKLAITIIVLSLLCLPAFSTVVLVQSVTGGSASASVLSGGTLTTSNGNFTTPTVAGDLIVCVSYFQNIGGGGGDQAIPVIAGGYGSTFSASYAEGVYEDGFDKGSTQINYIGNAPSMTSSNTITVQATNDGIHTGTVSEEFDLYEFSGIAFPLVQQFKQINCCGSSSGSNPSVSFGGSTSDTDLIIVGLTALAGSNISAGGSYTLGINGSVAVVGQIQYLLNAAPGQSSAAFVGTEPFWATTVITFKAGPTASSAVPRHRGFVN